MNAVNSVPSEAGSNVAFLSSFFGLQDRQEHKTENDALTEFIAELRSDLELERKLLDMSDSRKIAIVKEITTKLDEAQDTSIALEKKWKLACDAENLALSLLDVQRQKSELYRRFNQCLRTQAPFTPIYEAKILALDNDSSGADECVSLLMPLVQDMQQYYSSKHIKIQYEHDAICRVGMAFGLSLILSLLILSLSH